MKIRTNFVTNSSSSSFIIGYHDDDITKDIVFRMIRDLYIDRQNNFERLMKDAPSWNIHFDKEDRCFRHNNEDKDSREKNQATNRLLEKEYGFSTWESFDEKNLDWLKLESYKEYEEYWLKVMEEAHNKDWRSYTHAPFTIIDYENDDTYIDLHDGYEFSQKHIPVEKRASENDEFGWYFECNSYIFDEKLRAEGRHNCEYCPVHGEKDCKKLTRGIEKGEITDENALTMVLGKICISSECGYIPENITTQLSQICNFSCNHMG